jgi:signal transduction histidine kinase
MPFAHTTFARSSLLMLLVGCALLVAIVGSSFFLARSTQTYFQGVAKLRDVRSGAADLVLYLRAAESGQRGYLLSEDETFLKPYQTALTGLPKVVGRFRAAVAAAGDVDVPMDQLQTLIDAKAKEMTGTVELGQKGDFAGATAVVRGDYGRQLMDNISTILGQVVRSTDKRLSDGIEDLNRSAASLQWVTVGGGLVIVMLVIGGIVVVAQHVRALRQAQSEVEALNSGLEERVNERTEDLIQANREIQRYAYIVSHDLRAPLVNIMGFTSELDASLKSIAAYVLADEDNRPGEQEAREARLAVEEDLPEAIGFIRSSTKKMDALINAILKISRDGRRELKPERVDLADILDMTAASINHQVQDADGKVEISVAAARGLVTDRFSMEQIFGNLFDNAVKYRDPKTPLQLAVKASPAGRGSLKIEVSDNGRGIAPQDHERIFELFRRSGTQDQPGEGIGLAHVRSLVRNLGGDITVKSTLGGGTTFVIRLPTDLSQYVRSNGS